MCAFCYHNASPHNFDAYSWNVFLFSAKHSQLCECKQSSKRKTMPHLIFKLKWNEKYSGAKILRVYWAERDFFCQNPAPIFCENFAKSSQKKVTELEPRMSQNRRKKERKIMRKLITKLITRLITKLMSFAAACMLTYMPPQMTLIR